MPTCLRSSTSYGNACTGGLSERAFGLVALVLVPDDRPRRAIGSIVLIILGAQQIVSTGIIAFFCRRYRGQACASHRPAAGLREPLLITELG
jgi:hypothetical protein